MHHFDEKEVTAFAAWLLNQGHAKHARGANLAEMGAADARTSGEIAARVFERFEQRQSIAEIVIGERIPPDRVRELFDQWGLGLIEGHLRSEREPSLPRAPEVERVTRQNLEARLAALPENEVTRITVARFRENIMYGDHDYPSLVELGGFHVGGPCTLDAITERFGRGSHRVTAYGFEPPAIRWEVIASDLPAFDPTRSG